MLRRIPPYVLWLGLAGCATPRGSPLEAVQRELPDIESERLAMHRAPACAVGYAEGGPRLSLERVAGRSAEDAFGIPDESGLSRAYALDDVPVREQHGPVAEATASGDRVAPLPSFWKTLKRDVKGMPGGLWSDTKKVYGSPTNLLILGLSYGGALAVQETGPDDTVERHYERHHAFNEDWRDAFGAMGNPGVHFALAGAWYLAGQQTQHEKTYNVGRKLFSALIINDLSTLVGKAASWDDTPNGEAGAFPSGHTSSTFALAAVMHEEYGPLVGIPLYGVGTLVAIERMDAHEHYLSDVLFGGVLGLVIGHTVAAEKPLELFGGQIVPYTDPESQSTGLAWWKQFE